MKIRYLLFFKLVVIFLICIIQASEDSASNPDPMKRYYTPPDDIDNPEWLCKAISTNKLKVFWMGKYGLEHSEECNGIWYNIKQGKIRLTWKDNQVKELECSNIVSIYWQEINN